MSDISAFPDGLPANHTSALSGPVPRGELVAPGAEELEDSGDIDIIDIDNLRYLEEAARCGWWLPTGTLAVLLDVAPTSVSNKGDYFRALGFEFTRTYERWKGSIQWSVAKVARPE